MPTMKAPQVRITGGSMNKTLLTTALMGLVALHSTPLQMEVYNAVKPTVNLDHDDEAALASAQAKRDRKNAKRLARL